MNGAARMPKHITELAVAPISGSIAKGTWWRSSPPPRLLLVLLLFAQVLFIAIVRLGPSGFLWKLNSGDGLPSPSSSSSSSTLEGMQRPFDDLPQRVEAEQSSVSSSSSKSFNNDGDQGAMASTDETAYSVINSQPGEQDADFDPLTSRAPWEQKENADKESTPSQVDLEKENTDKGTPSQVDAVELKLSATAVATSIDVAKQEYSLIADKVLGNQRNTVDDKPYQGAHEFMPPEELIPHASDIINYTKKGEHSANDHGELGAMDGENTVLAVKDHGQLAATHGDALIVGKVNVQNVNKDLGSSSDCSDGYIYVYDLPPVYNQDITANCTALNAFTNVCNTLLNGGLGPSLGEASPLGQVGSWFRSDQFTAEIVFHKRMLQHLCVTDKLEQASSFYVPYYVGLDVGRYLWGASAEDRDRVSNRMLEWLVQQPAWKSKDGWGHFLVVGRISWDFRRSKDEDWGSRFFNHPSMENMTRLLIEKNPWDYMEMAVPYPTNFHPQSDRDLVAWQNHIRVVQRSSLFSFAGAPRSTFTNDFRGILLNQCQQAQSCRSLDCSKRTCENNQRTLELFMDSNFCLQPRGDSFTRRSTFDCLLAGSIPVFFWRRTAYMQYKWHLPEDVKSYSVFISKEAMGNGTKIEDVLSSYSPEKVQKMREVVIGLVPRIVYAVSEAALEQHKDAFDVAIEGVMKMFKSRNSI